MTLDRPLATLLKTADAYLRVAEKVKRDNAC